MDRFHQVIQIAMGWQNYHLHEFRIKNRDIGMPDPDAMAMAGFPNPEEESKVYLREFDLQIGDTFKYLYDFGDDWEHLIRVEDVSDQQVENPICLAGKRACPPEDSGGIWGYLDMLEAVKDKKHPEYQMYRQWLSPDFRADFFPITAINDELKKFGAWHRKHPRKKSTPWHMI